MVIFAAGACGYKDYGKTINGGEVSGVSRLFKNGTGCGACYQVILLVAFCKKDICLFLCVVSQ